MRSLWLWVAVVWIAGFAAEWLREPNKLARLARGTVTRSLRRPIADVWQVGEMAVAGAVVLAALMIVGVWSLCLNITDRLRNGTVSRRASGDHPGR